MLPSDNHVHSEWSWDAPGGAMDRTCAQAVALGLPSVAFTEHADLTPWTLQPGERIPDAWRPLVTDGVLTPPPLDLDGYRRCLQRCRDRYPGLRILSGVELGEPHWHAPRAAELLDRGRFDRVLASVHSADTGGAFAEISTRYHGTAPEQVVREYLAETSRLIERFADFEVLAHIDYPVRSWPAGAAPFDPGVLEAEYRAVLRSLAAADKVLEVNTRLPLHPRILGWWRQEGGRAITFASDAHEPSALARGFAEAVAVARAAGFRPTDDPHDFWCRT